MNELKVNTYWKALVIALSDLGDSKIVLEKNCTKKNLNKIIKELDNNYQESKYFKTVVEMPMVGGIQ